MPFIIARFVVPDFDTWKSESFDADAAGRQKVATGYRLYRAAGNPNNVVVVLEFPSIREARAFRKGLVDSKGFEQAFGAGIQNPQAWLAEEVETVTY